MQFKTVIYTTSNWRYSTWMNIVQNILRRCWWCNFYFNNRRNARSDFSHLARCSRFLFYADRTPIYRICSAAARSSFYEFRFRCTRSRRGWVAAHARFLGCFYWTTLLLAFLMWLFIFGKCGFLRWNWILRLLYYDVRVETLCQKFKLSHRNRGVRRTWGWCRCSECVAGWEYGICNKTINLVRITFALYIL